MTIGSVAIYGDGLNVVSTLFDSTHRWGCIINIALVSFINLCVYVCIRYIY